jgi:hypothetical protein
VHYTTLLHNLQASGAGVSITAIVAVEDTGTVADAESSDAEELDDTTAAAAAAAGDAAQHSSNDDDL